MIFSYKIYSQARIEKKSENPSHNEFGGQDHPKGIYSVKSGYKQAWTTHCNDQFNGGIKLTMVKAI